LRKLAQRGLRGVKLVISDAYGINPMPRCCMPLERLNGEIKRPHRCRRKLPMLERNEPAGGPTLTGHHGKNVRVVIVFCNRHSISLFGRINFPALRENSLF
jgi:hypothetical protein